MVYKVRVPIQEKNSVFGFNLFEKALAFAFADDEITIETFYKFQNLFIRDLKEYSLVNYSFRHFWERGSLCLSFEAPKSNSQPESFCEKIATFFAHLDCPEIEIVICKNIPEEEMEYTGIESN